MTTRWNRRGSSIKLFLLLLLHVLDNHLLDVVADQSLADHWTQNSAFAWREGLRDHYSYDGSFNNLDHPSWGAANTSRIRNLPAENNYLDGLSQVDDLDLPSARRVMEELFHATRPKPDKMSNQLLLQFGHFILHDITFSRPTAPLDNSENTIMMAPCDGKIIEPVMCPFLGKNFTIPRVDYEQSSYPRRSINIHSAFLDMSNLYGQDQATVQMVRGPAGQMALDAQGFPLRDSHGHFKVAFPHMTTDPAVFSLYVVFMRYHNHRAQIHVNHTTTTNTTTTIDDDVIFHLARMDTIAVYQKVVYEKYLPILLGGDSLDRYQGYNASVNPSMDVFFSTVAFRYGHSVISNIFRVMDKNFVPMPEDPLISQDLIDGPSAILNIGRGGIEAILRGLVVTPGKASDLSMVKDMNFIHFATVFDIARGRDNGIPFFNDVRQAFGYPRIQSFQELVAQYNSPQDHSEKLLAALQDLYGNSIDRLDAFVGALMEEPANHNSLLGPLFAMSIKDQFQRLRDGDRLYFRHRLNATEQEALPSLTQVFQMVCDPGEMDNFPLDYFTLVDLMEESSCMEEDSLQRGLSLLGGRYSATWSFQDTQDHSEGVGDSLEMTLYLAEEMVGPGFMGIGWRKQKMIGSEMWFCYVDRFLFDEIDAQKNETCTHMGHPQVFECCLATFPSYDGARCYQEGDSLYYNVSVTGACLAQTETKLSISVPVCNTGFEHLGNCFHIPNGDIDYIAAYNSMALKVHGPLNRAYGLVNMVQGTSYKPSMSTGQVGFFAAHGLFMLFSWTVCAPLAIFVVRYMKTQTWRLAVHVTLMSMCGGLMIPLVVNTELSVPQSTRGEHKVLGLLLACVYVIMATTGRVRYLILEGQKLGWWKKTLSFFVHKFGGLGVLVCAFWQCYTGLIRIGPNDTGIEVFTLNSYPLGYNIPFFGVMREFFWYYAALLVICFCVAEYQLMQLRNAKHLDEIIKGAATIWEDSNDIYLEKMTLKTFLDLTRNGRELCIVDGKVLDLAGFMDFHPGGRNLLRFAQGADVTKEILGQRDVDGVRHAHSPAALNRLRTLVTAEIDTDGGSGSQRLKTIRGSVLKTSLRRSSSDLQLDDDSAGHNEQTFRTGRITGISYLTPGLAYDCKAKQIVLLKVALPHSHDIDVAMRLSSKGKSLIPGCAFTIRGRDDRGATFERPYTPLRLCHDFVEDPNSMCKLRHSLDKSSDFAIRHFFDEETKKKIDEEEEIHEFLITLLPGGKMSKYFLKMKPGASLLMQGPRYNPAIIHKVNQTWSNVVMFAAGTGISPMLQLIDYYLASPKTCPEMSLVWLLSSPKHSYLEATKLEGFVKRSYGKLKFVVLYSSHSSNHSSSHHQHGGGPLGNNNSNNTKPDEEQALPKDKNPAYAGSAPQQSWKKRIQEKLVQLEYSVVRLGLMAFKGGKQNLGDFIMASRLLGGNGDHGVVYPDASGGICWGYFMSAPFDSFFVQQVFQSLNIITLDGDEEDAPAVSSSTLIALSGSPRFESTCFENLEAIGVEDEQLLTFYGSTSPLSDWNQFAKPCTQHLFSTPIQQDAIQKENATFDEDQTTEEDEDLMDGRHVRIVEEDEALMDLQHVRIVDGQVEV